MNFKTIRITVLLLILAYFGLDTLLNNQRATNWTRSVRVVIYPINADGSEAASDYIAQINSEQFDIINTRLVSEAKRYNLSLDTPFIIAVAPELKTKPPTILNTTSTLKIILWSIKLRYWAWKNDNYTGPKAQIKAYALYYDPATHEVLDHSTGLKESKLAINHLFASTDQSQQNNIVLLHEILHTLGATDKYNLQTTLPSFPDGYGNPLQEPRYPQENAEIMGGRIALSESKAQIPESLNSVIVGKLTAKEIGWIK